MLESFLLLLDKVAQLATLRESKRRRLLDDYARPILKKMEDIHNDYRNSLTNARKLLQEDASPATVLETIQKSKWQLQPVRDRVTASVKAIIARETQLDETGQCFFLSLDEYFGLLGSSSVYTCVIRDLEIERPRDESLANVIDLLEIYWRSVSDSFAKFEASLA